MTFKTDKEYYDLQKHKWDEEFPVFDDLSDTYFENWDEIIEHCIDERVNIINLRLYYTKYADPPHIDIERLIESGSFDGYEYELPEAAVELIEKVNKIIADSYSVRIYDYAKAVLIPDSIIQEYEQEKAKQEREVK
ncbi:MAG: hypothetical protein PHS34_08630 [Candidatus Omnitrophica bacterium]|nr:hypothetical protein [Candidatus Omnitrophota bacterium]